VSKGAASLTEDALNEKASAYFAAAFNRPDTPNVAITASYSATGGSSVTVTGSTTIDTQFMGLVGINSIPISSSSKTAWGMRRLRVALALDTTGSMSSAGKMTALKDATKSLLTQLQTAASTPGDVYVSIVPFVKDVNAGSSNYEATWIDWTEWEAPPPNSMPSSSVGPGSSCPYSNWDQGFHCMSEPANGSQSTSSIPSSGTYAGYICPSAKGTRHYNGCYNSVPTTTTSTTVVDSGRGASCGNRNNCTCTGSGRDKVCKQTTTTTGAPYTHTWITNARSTWTGCVMDRGDSNAPSSGNYDTTVTAPNSSITATLYPAEQYSACPQAVMGLNYDWTAMTTLVDAMSPNGNTNQGIGLAWGWLSLAGGGPFTVPPKDANYKYTEALILLSDGANTENRWYSNSASIDARQKMTCDNAKAANVTIYTIQLNTGSDPLSSVLQDCASDSKKFFYLTSSSQISGVFNTIGTNLSKLRIAQ
jgi:hypothetical protein